MSKVSDFSESEVVFVRGRPVLDFY